MLELSHEIDYLYWLFKDFKSVYCSLVNSGKLNIETEDIADIILFLKINFLLIFIWTSTQEFRIENVLSEGQKGILSGMLSEKSFYKKIKKSKSLIFSDEQSDMYHSQLIHFFDCIEKNAEPKVTLNDGLASMKLIDASIKSNKSGKVKFL